MERGKTRGLFRTSPNQNDGNRSNKDFEIQPERPVINVFKVEPHPVAEVAHVVAPADLPETSEPRLYRKAAPMREVIEALHFIHRQWTRPDETHLAEQNVPDLRPFIEAVF